MSRRPPLAALEGPCCAGKTTLGHLLLRDLHGLTIAFAPCYADHAGGGRFLPRQEAHSVPEREQALRELLRLEAGRLALAEKFGATPVNLTDGDPAQQIIDATGGAGADRASAAERRGPQGDARAIACLASLPPSC